MIEVVKMDYIQTILEKIDNLNKIYSKHKISRYEYCKKLTSLTKDLKDATRLYNTHGKD